MNNIHSFINKVKNFETIEKKDLQVFASEQLLAVSVEEMKMLPAYLRQFDLSPDGLSSCIGDPIMINETIADVRNFISIIYTALDCVKKGVPFDYKTRIFFGLVSSIHISTFEAAIRESRFDAAGLQESVQSSARFNEYMRRLLGGLPVTFRLKLDFSASYLSEEIQYESPLSFSTSHADFLMKVSNTYELWQLAKDDGLPETDTVAWLENTIDDGAVLYDIGACLGFFSLYARNWAKRLRLFPLNLTLSITTGCA